MNAKTEPNFWPEDLFFLVFTSNLWNSRWTLSSVGPHSQIEINKVFVPPQNLFIPPITLSSRRACVVRYTSKQKNYLLTNKLKIKNASQKSTCCRFQFYAHEHNCSSYHITIRQIWIAEKRLCLRSHEILSRTAVEASLGRMFCRPALKSLDYWDRQINTCD